VRHKKLTTAIFAPKMDFENQLPIYENGTFVKLWINDKLVSEITPTASSYYTPRHLRCSPAFDHLADWYGISPMAPISLPPLTSKIVVSKKEYSCRLKIMFISWNVAPCLIATVHACLSWHAAMEILAGDLTVKSTFRLTYVASFIINNILAEAVFVSENNLFFCRLFAQRELYNADMAVLGCMEPQVASGHPAYRLNICGNG